MNRSFLKKMTAWVLAAGLCLTLGRPLGGHSYRIPLLVDTDMALDDMRAVILLVNQGHADIRLFTTSDGAQTPSIGLRSLRRLLIRLGHGGIPLAAGRRLDESAPAWREWTEKILGGNQENGSREGTAPPRAAQAMTETLRRLNTKAVVLALGPLTNLADALNGAPEIKEKISRVVFFGSAPNEAGTAWNTQRDRTAVDKVVATGLPMFFIDSPARSEVGFDIDFFRKIEDMHAPAADSLVQIHRTAEVRTKLESGHFEIWDELGVIYLHRPDLFRFVASGKTSFVLSGFDPARVKEAYLKSLGYASDMHLDDRETVVFKAIPTDPPFFQEDLRPYVQRIIQRYGLEEWKSLVLTNEFHRHLGAYSIIGAKMGIRAREILEAPFDTISVISHAGDKPPLSCLNDGLQMATGASLGRGTIRVATGRVEPQAVFSGQKGEITLRLKKGIEQRIEADIRQAISAFGDLTPAYFKQIRRISIQYWWELDRARIFDERK